VRLQSSLALFRPRLKNLTYRVLNRLEFFPFTFLYLLSNAALKLILLRRHDGRVCVGRATGDARFLPRDVMLWLGRVLIGPQGCQFDVCLRLSREDASANLQDAFSVALAFPGVRSVGLYWDSSRLADDLPLLQSTQDSSDRVASATSFDEIGSQGSDQFVKFLDCGHAEFALPVTATRDAQTLLKRLVGAAYTICFNVPSGLRTIAKAVVEARADLQFLHFSPESPEFASVTNNQSFFGWGLSLHERMAFVQAADVYIGSFDELGCTALVSRRPAILLGGVADALPHPLRRGDATMWFPGQPEPEALTQMVLQFLSEHLPTHEGVIAEIYHAPRE
jgi:hypothetical protein